ncbi:hypothetical protein [Fulvimarina sp. MAC8]|uniref:hypothetical protein n=1 Tax=Fulvimarina sp. MAC8 TaxID=3162874 RepID=UPI0032EE30B1
MCQSNSLVPKKSVRAVAPILFALLAAIAPLDGAAANESAYTKIDFNACKTLSFTEEGGSVSLRCPGYQGIPIYYNEGDLRVDVDFGSPNTLFETFSPFNSTGDTVEWRLSDGEPIAAILRFHLDPGDGGEKGQVLSVHAMGTLEKPGCAVAYVDARANPMPTSSLGRRLTNSQPVSPAE